MIGQGKTLEIRFTPYGSYTGDDGTVKNGNSYDVSVFNAIMEVDFILKQEYAASAITACAWIFS